MYVKPILEYVASMVLVSSTVSKAQYPLSVTGRYLSHSTTHAFPLLNSICLTLVRFYFRYGSPLYSCSPSFVLVLILIFYFSVFCPFLLSFHFFCYISYFFYVIKCQFDIIYFICYSISSYVLYANCQH